jgi:hypothetical protein
MEKIRKRRERRREGKKEKMGKICKHGNFWKNKIKDNL